MCGIVGYVGQRPARDIVLAGLGRLEYRGYDSAGLAIVGADGKLTIERRAGPLANLRSALDGQLMAGGTGIGHTRWATHGAPTDRNAHPQRDCTGTVAVVHNGIIANHAELREALLATGHEFTSDTDTEVVAHLLEEALAGEVTLAEALRSVCRGLRGAFTLVAAHAGEPGVIVAARRSSPLVLGVGEGEVFLASDVTAFIAHTRRAVWIGQDRVVEVRGDGFTVTDFAGEPAPWEAFEVDWDTSAAEKGGHRWFMDKEIAEQPAAVADTLLGRLTGDGHIALDEERLAEEELRATDKVFVVACGSSFYAGLLAKYAIEHWTRLPCEVELASEFRYRDPVLDRSTLVLAISQSGETMDTLEAVRHAREQKARVLAICNTVGSQIPRESDAVLYTRAGPEVCVASTKTLSAQIAASYLVGLELARVRGTLDGDEVTGLYRQLERMPAVVSAALGELDPVRALGRSLAARELRQVLFLGRHVGYPVALEGALKLMELSYLPAQAFPAGELKHGPIALIEPGTVVVVVMPSPRARAQLHDKVLANLAEVRARGAVTLVVGERADGDAAALADHFLGVAPTPTLLSPLVTLLPLQVLAREIADARGRDVDRPRNLAKSVTVE